MTGVRARLTSRRRLDRLHRDVLSAMDDALNAADSGNATRRHVKLDRKILRVGGMAYPLTRYRRIFVVGGGKASGGMGEAIESMLKSKITAGLIVVPDYPLPRPRGDRIKYVPASHPIPTRQNVRAVRQMLELIEDPSRDDLVIVVLSGGASALLDYPSEGVTLADERKTTLLLLKSGANIKEINTVRKRLSRLNGGRLAQMLEPARVLTLIISDVVGDQLDVIGSGPTTPDPSSYRDAKEILAKYNLVSDIPTGVQWAIAQGLKGVLPDTPKPGDRVFHSVRTVIVGSIKDSCKAAESRMRSAGYHSKILSTRMTGEARRVGHNLGTILKDVRDIGVPVSPPAALICGGETTVTVRGDGTGGRNQELALAGAISISGSQGLLIGSLATDGVDGPTDAAGALADGSTVTRGREFGMKAEEYLSNNDSYSYFSKLGDLVKTGPTRTNVSDIMIIAAK